jgi:hypothetical protein
MSLGDFRAIFFPYCLQKQKDGRYAVLNREYKPVGFYTTDWVKYEEHPVLVKLKGLTKSKAAKLSDKGEANLDEISLYSDATNPVRSKANMRSYLAKLEILASLSVA